MPLATIVMIVIGLIAAAIKGITGQEDFMALFQQSEELSTMAEILIADHYPEIARNGLRIAYLFKQTMPKKAGVCRKVSDLDRQLHGFDFTITINHDLWDAAAERGDPEWQKAILDHELAHVGISIDEESGEPKRDEESGLIKTTILKHNVEEFEDILGRYGTYADDLRRFIRVYQARQEGVTVTPVQVEEAGR